jgi:hypothetical protein
MTHEHFSFMVLVRSCWLFMLKKRVHNLARHVLQNSFLEVEDPSDLNRTGAQVFR